MFKASKKKKEEGEVKVIAEDFGRNGRKKFSFPETGTLIAADTLEEAVKIYRSTIIK